ncbi:MAG TPA: hypothetical protein VGM87_03060 [Roseomonas sp.]|jgi:hypothetical protein
MTEVETKPPTPAMRRPDATVLALLAGGVVLVLAVAWLLTTPRPVPGVDPRVAALEERLASLEARRPPEAPSLAPVERRLATLEARPLPAAPDQGPAIAALERRVAAAEQRPDPDLSALAPRAAVEDLAARIAPGAERLAALESRVANAEAAQRQAEAAQTRITALEARLAATEGTQQGRIATLETRLAAAEATQPRIAALEAAQTRVAALEAAQSRVTDVEARARRLAAQDALRARLDAGQPLAPALSALPEAPASLTRFAAAAPPTEAGLRLSFEDAARAARAASEPAREGQGVVDSALARLSGLVTVRRGDEVVWGDQVAGALERARRSLDAGDLAGTVEQLKRLPAPARNAMERWIGDAEALLAARAALGTLAG